MAKDITRLSAVELARLIRTRKLGPVEVAQAHLTAIARVNPAVNAFCTVAPEKTLAWAREAEAAVKKRGKLGPHRHRRHPHDFRIDALPRPRPHRGCRGRAQAQGGRRDRSRQDQHA
jgi:hypothetical protein